VAVNLIALRPPKTNGPPLSSPKPPAFIGKPRGRCHHLPFCAFSIDDLALIKVISADLDFLHSYPPMLMVGQPRRSDPFQTC
jgi:hypothetical protein